MSCTFLRWMTIAAAALICGVGAGQARAQPSEAPAWQPEELALLRLDDSGPWKLAAATPLSATLNTEVGEAHAGKAWARVSRDDGLWLVEIGCGNFDFAYRFMTPMGSDEGIGAAPVERCHGSWFKALVGRGVSVLPPDPFPDFDKKPPADGGDLSKAAPENAPEPPVTPR